METTHETRHWAHRRAHRRASWRMRLADELFRYVIATTLLVILVRPIGILVGLVWGLGIARRLYRGEVEPRLRRRFVRGELRRCGHGRSDDGPPRRRAGPEDLAAEMGDDPRAPQAVDWARTALDELADGEGRPARSADTLVRMADVVDDVVDVLEGSAERDGIAFHVELDAEGEVEGDGVRLKAALLDLVSESVHALRRGARGPARVRVQMGENLAGSEVWVRIRDDRLDAAAGARGVYGSRPVPGIPGATLETQASPQNGVERVLTLKKFDPRGAAAARHRA